MVDAGVEFVTEPRTETYGRIAVFVDIAGNRWDLLCDVLVARTLESDSTDND